MTKGNIDAHVRVSRAQADVYPDVIKELETAGRRDQQKHLLELGFSKIVMPLAIVSKIAEWEPEKVRSLRRRKKIEAVIIDGVWHYDLSDVLAIKRKEREGIRTSGLEP